MAEEAEHEEVEEATSEQPATADESMMTMLEHISSRVGGDPRSQYQAKVAMLPPVPISQPLVSADEYFCAYRPRWDGYAAILHEFAAGIPAYADVITAATTTASTLIAELDAARAAAAEASAASRRGRVIQPCSASLRSTGKKPRNWVCRFPM
mgnify:CR=1 FL=1